MTKRIKLDKEEAELLATVEAGEWRSVKNLDREIKRSQEYARATLVRTAASIFAFRQRTSPAAEKGIGGRNPVSDIDL